MPRQNRSLIDTPYIRTHQLPPLHPDDREDFIRRLTALYNRINENAEIERRKQLLSWAHLAP